MMLCSHVRVRTERSGKLVEAREGWMAGRRVTGVAVNLGRAAGLLFMVSMSVSTIKKVLLSALPRTVCDSMRLTERKLSLPRRI